MCMGVLSTVRPATRQIIVTGTREVFIEVDRDVAAKVGVMNIQALAPTAPITTTARLLDGQSIDLIPQRTKPMHRFPYLLPNIVGASMALMGLPMVFCFLKETYQLDNGGNEGR